MCLFYRGLNFARMITERVKHWSNKLRVADLPRAGASYSTEKKTKHCISVIRRLITGFTNP